MKKVILLVFIFFSLSICNVFGASQYSSTILRIEKSLLGVDFENQSDENRLKRLEETVYGSAKSGSLKARIESLSKDVGANQMGKEISPKRDTFAEDDDEIKEIMPKADKNIKYPAIDALEQKVFGKTSQNDVTVRLKNLEQKVFKKTYNDDLNSRTERLKAHIQPQKMANYDENDESDENFDNYYNYFSNENTGAAAPITSPDDFAKKFSYEKSKSVLDGDFNNNYATNEEIKAPITALEKKVFKKTYPEDTISTRLVRLEVKFFSTTFTEDDDKTRFDRVASAYQASKSTKRYDNNKFSQHAATAMQIGAFLLMILAVIL